MDKNLLQQKEEEYQWAMRYFDLAECPVKEWIANYLDVSPEEIFFDFKDNTDVISMEHDGKYYNIYLSPYEPDVSLDKELLENSDKLKMAAGILFKALCSTYGSIVASMDAHKEKMNNIIFKFNEELLCFHFTRINKPSIEKQQTQNNLLGAIQQMNKLHEHKVDISDMEQYKELEQKLIKLQIELTSKLSTFNDDEIEKEEKLCAEMNPQLEKDVKLFLVIENNSNINDDTVYKRLPVIGNAYVNPDDETELDKFKKENNVE